MLESELLQNELARLLLFSPLPFTLTKVIDLCQSKFIA